MVHGRHSINIMNEWNFILQNEMYKFTKWSKIFNSLKILIEHSFPHNPQISYGQFYTVFVASLWKNAGLVLYKFMKLIKFLFFTFPFGLSTLCPLPFIFYSVFLQLQFRPVIMNTTEWWWTCALSLLSSIIATSHMWLLSTQNVPSTTEKLNF